MDAARKSKFLATHTAELYCGELLDVRQEPNSSGKSVWIDVAGTEYPRYSIHNLVAIPGQSVEQESDDCSRVKRRPPHRILDDGRIVALSGKPWSLKGTALRILRDLSMGETHTVDGFGNTGPRGREWWIRKKQTCFVKIPYLKNDNNMPVDMFSQYTIDFCIDTLEQRKCEELFFDVKRIGCEWNLKFHTKLGVVGFQNEQDYQAFLTHVLGDVA